MQSALLQQQFFNHLKDIIPPHVSMVDELASLLDLSHDSVYRRIRGEKDLGLNELRQICERYHISLDQVLQLKNDNVVFQATTLDKPVTAMLDFLKRYLEQLKYINSFYDKKMFYVCKDLPIWQFYLFPEIAAFKTFFWSKTILNLPEFRNQYFSLDSDLFLDCFETGQQINAIYNQIPCVELYNKESINSTLSQIEYYRDAGFFKGKRDFETVIDSFDLTLIHLEKQAEKGHKFTPGSPDENHQALLQIYINEVVIGSNTILAEINSKQITFIPYNVFSYLLTTDQRFNRTAFSNFNTLLTRSTLISSTGEKERIKFFRSWRQKVKDLLQ